MFGFRPEGRRVKQADPVVQITPYLMPMRCDAQVFLEHEIEYEPLVRFIAEKGKEGNKITFMEILIASYVRAISQLPEANRFIMNKQLFARKELTVSFTLVMDSEDDKHEENAVKIAFDPSDTIYDVSKRVKATINANRKAENTSNGVVNFANFLLKIPFLATFAVGAIRFLDKYGLIPKSIIDISPFHTGLFIANMASIGMSKVYHHIYNFGNTGLFFSIGNVKRGYRINAKGEKERHCTLPIGITADERVCAGIVYAKFFALIRAGLKDPSTLESPPTQVNYADGIEYHVKKPD